MKRASGISTDIPRIKAKRIERKSPYLLVTPRLMRRAQPSFRGMSLIRQIRKAFLQKETDWGSACGAEIWLF